jgi:divalent metal cation (Fe/Co/Zn/Cd) transporter
MSASGGGKAIIAAFLANMGIAAAKFVAWILSGSASMLAEAIHSVADSGNQLLLLLGGRRAKRTADRSHPFGHGRERYVYAFVVSIILFSVGGLFSIYEGVDKLTHPHELENVWIPIGVLLIAIVLESFSLRTAIKESNHNPVFDAIGTLMIGTLLILVAITLGIETKSLLVGEGATDADHERIVDAIMAGPEVEKLIHIKTLYLGPDELLVAAKIALPADKTVREAADDIDLIEARIREAVPTARVVYLEPDIYRPAIDPEPSTDVFVLKSSD